MSIPLVRSSPPQPGKIDLLNLNSCLLCVHNIIDTLGSHTMFFPREGCYVMSQLMTKNYCSNDVHCILLLTGFSFFNFGI